MYILYKHDQSLNILLTGKVSAYFIAFLGDFTYNYLESDSEPSHFFWIIMSLLFVNKIIWLASNQLRANPSQLIKIKSILIVLSNGHFFETRLGGWLKINRMKLDYFTTILSFQGTFLSDWKMIETQNFYISNLRRTEQTKSHFKAHSLTRGKGSIVSSLLPQTDSKNLTVKLPGALCSWIFCPARLSWWPPSHRSRTVWPDRRLQSCHCQSPCGENQ